MNYYNGSSYTFTWEGRRLVGAVKGSNTMSFEYNDEGIRTSKTVNGVETVYYVNGGQIVAEKTGTRTIVYIYDASGAPIGMMYRTTSYAEGAFDVFWYEKNLQGDIVAVYNSSGTKLVTYDYYDAWGNFTVSYSNSGATTGAQYNPFRYRGYYYDSDLGMYYLQSRYYDAKICRFINADIFVSTGQGVIGFNMFAYCRNQVTTRVDDEGTVDETCISDDDDLLDESWQDGKSAGGGAGPTTSGSSGYGGYGGYSSSTAQSSSKGVCFIAGTMVKTAEGDIPIEDIEVGDLVYAHNPETGETELKTVVNTFVNEATELVHVFANGEEIICTNEHPFYSPVKGWIEACQLCAGDILVSLNGEYIEVEQVQHEILESPIKVYNFEVEDFHTYFVGDGDGVLVHNTCKADQQLTNKLDYVFGKATGNEHNINRSKGLSRSLENIGINDTPSGRSYMLNQFKTIRNQVGLSDTSYSSLIYGPSGILLMETHWVNGTLKTVFIYGKWGK